MARQNDLLTLLPLDYFFRIVKIIAFNVRLLCHSKRQAFLDMKTV